MDWCLPALTSAHQLQDAKGSSKEMDYQPRVLKEGCINCFQHFKRNFLHLSALMKLSKELYREGSANPPFPFAQSQKNKEATQSDCLGLVLAVFLQKNLRNLAPEILEC